MGVAGCALKQYGVPFVMIEKASRSKICSNAGSGFELAPTAIEILSRLGVDIYKIMAAYEGMAIYTMEGQKVRHSSVKGYNGGSLNRADMQKFMLENLFPNPKDEEGVLFCGSGIETYSEDEEKGQVVATLENGQTITGCVLLACDGIHSRCRAVMHGGYDSKKDWETNARTMNANDPLHFCNTLAYWGKTPVAKGSDLEKAFSETQTFKGGKSTNFVVGLTTSKVPSSLFVFPTEKSTMLSWAILVGSETERLTKTNDGKDLTRRGGGALTEDEKKRLFDVHGQYNDSNNLLRGMKDFPIIEKLIEATPAKDMTEAALYDREKLDLPYSTKSKLVALLGDAAHPQTPMMGQGANMSITDAYVYATNIAVALRTKKKSLREAISDCDTEIRRKANESVVRDARSFCYATVSTNFLVCWLFWLFCKFVPTSEFMNQIVKSDKSNRDYLHHLDHNQCSPKEQEALRNS